MNETPQVLVADDDREMRWVLRNLLSKEGLRVVEAEDGERALEVIRSEAHPDLILLDNRMPKVSGEDVLRRARSVRDDLPVIMITAFGDVDHAVRMVRAGASDYFVKPIDHQQLLRAVHCALRGKVAVAPERRGGPGPDPADLHAVMGYSAAVAMLAEKVRRVAETSFSVLIQGETGAGKEVVARAVHAQSRRAKRGLVAVDCGAIPENLMESELFGHERGAFTGADRQRRGKFEVAEGGTLFLDEVSNLSAAMQAKLLRVLQERCFYRVGSNRPMRCDVRVIAASGEDLVTCGHFRRDLYFRLAEYVVRVPPLRARREDVLYLAERFVRQAEGELRCGPVRISDEAELALTSFHWPGNVRELRNVVRSAVLQCDGVVEPSHLDLLFHPERGDEELMVAPVGPFASPDADDQVRVTVPFVGLPLKEVVKLCRTECERQVIDHVLREVDGNKAEAARVLQVDYKTLHSKVKRYRLGPDGGPGTPDRGSGN